MTKRRLAYSALLLCAAIGWTNTDQASAAGLTITGTTKFSMLDGGPSDMDGCVNGILEVESLTVKSTGVLTLNTESARFAVHGDILVENSGNIRIPSIINSDAGPTVTFSTFGNFTMKNDALIRSHGRLRGGRIIVMALGNIELKDRAKIEAHNAALNIVAGNIEMLAHGTIRLVNSTNRVTANGTAGGLVTLCSGASACPAIYINSVVNATGFKGPGGQVKISAEAGGVQVVGEPYRIAASGTQGNGTIMFFAHTTVSPNPPVTNPAAMVTALGNPCPP